MNNSRHKIPSIPGAIGLTHLKVYTSEGPDGLRGGCPHMHFTCTEGYVVLSGKRYTWRPANSSGLRRE